MVRDEIERYEDLIAEKSGLAPARIDQFLDLLFQYIETVPVQSFHESIPAAEAKLGEVDPDDVLYLACALDRDAAIWSDDPLSEQSLVQVFTTSAVINEFETR